MARQRRRSALLGGAASTCGVIGVLLAPGSALAVAPTCTDLTVKMLPGATSSGPIPCAAATGETITGASATPAHGTLTFADGTLTYQPADGFIGEDDFPVTVTASSGDTATINAAFLVDTPPVCSDSQAKIQPDQSLAVDVPCEDPDPDGFTVLFGAPAHGTLSADGKTYTPNPGFVGIDTIAYAADDTFLRSDEHVLTITVGTPPQPPQPQPEPQPQPKPQPTPKPPQVPAAPALAISVAHPAQALADARAHGVTLVVTSSVRATSNIRITVANATARKLGIGRLVGTRTVSLRAGARTIHVRLSRRARRALASAGRVTLTIRITATDAAGHHRTRTLRVRLSR